MTNPKTIIGLGEALFDIFHDQALLGGAPLNMTVHAHQLQNKAIMISRVGQDDLADQVLAELQSRQMPIDHIQTDPDHPTGTVYVSVDTAGQPAYQITPDVAWDFLQFDPDLEYLAARADAVCFGTLAQRSGQSASTIQRFLSLAHRAIRLFDINLRQQYYNRAIITKSLKLANALKLNEEELNVLKKMFNLDPDDNAAIASLIKTHDLQFAAVTRAEKGATIHTPDQTYTALPVPATPGGDAVGAGDATSAALLHGATRNWPWPKTLTLANHIGAHVASQKGACPPLSDTVKSFA